MYLGRIESGKSYKKFYFFFIILSLILIGVVIYFTLGRATVKIQPKKIVFATDFETKIMENPTEANSIPGKVLSFEDEESRHVASHDIKGYDEKAKGTVTIYNKRDKDQPLLTHTRLLSASGVIFKTQTRAVVPAGGQMNVDVVADQSGKVGNIEPGKFSIMNIWKGWQDKLYAESSLPMTGGYIEKPYVYGSTIDKALNMLAEQTYETNLTNLKQRISSQEKILDGAIKNEILEFSASIEPDTETDKFDIKIKTRTIVLVCNEAKLKELAGNNLKKEAPRDKEFLGISWDTFSSNLKSYDLDSKTAILTAHLEGEAQAKISANLFKKQELVGLDRYEIKKYFGKFEDVGSVEVFFKPFWAHRIPSMLDHFEIQIEQPN